MVSRKMVAIRPKIPSTIHVMVLIIASCGLCMLAGCRSASQRPTASPTPTLIQGQTLIVETETATPAASSTPSPVPSTTQASTSFEEPFNDNRNQWHTETDLLQVTEGKYVHRLDCPETHMSPLCGTFIRMPFSFARSLRLEIDARVVNASPGAEVLVSFQVRRSDVHYYFISYAITDGYYEVSYISQNGMTPMLPETPTNLILTAVGETNRLGFEANGFLLTPLINGQETAPVQNTDIREAGDTYLVILVARGHSAELHFDNLSVERISG